MKARFVTFLVLLALLLPGLVPVARAAGNEQRATFSSPIMVVNTSFLNVRTGPGIQYSVLVTVVGGSTLPVLGVARDRVWYQVSTVVGVGWVNSQYVLPRGDFSNVPFAEAPELLSPQVTTGTVPGAVTGDDTAVDMGFSTMREWGASLIVDDPLRSQPGLSGGELRPLTGDKSIIFTVVGATFAEGVPWVQLAMPDGTVGWVDQTKVLFRPFACELSAVVMRQSAELKRGPDGSGVNGNVFISEGHEAYLLDAVDRLYKIELQDGSVGWVEDSFILIRDRASVRSQYCDQGGAAARQAALGTTDATGATVNPDLTAAYAALPRVIINTGYLNIRSGPGAQYTSVITLAGGTELSVLGVAPDGVWYLVQGSFGQGWLNNEYVLFRGDGSRLPIIRNVVGQIASPQATVARGSVTLYAAPNLTLGTVGTLAGGAQVDVVARTPDFLWVQVRTDGGYGWVQAEFVTLSGDTSLIPVISG